MRLGAAPSGRLPHCRPCFPAAEAESAGNSLTQGSGRGVHLCPWPTATTKLPVAQHGKLTAQIASPPISLHTTHHTASTPADKPTPCLVVIAVPQPAPRTPSSPRLPTRLLLGRLWDEPAAGLVLRRQGLTQQAGHGGPRAVWRRPSRAGAAVAAGKWRTRGLHVWPWPSNCAQHCFCRRLRGSCAAP